jgi:hypothetical protein
MDGMTWKGRKSSGDQALAWSRREVRLDGENKRERYLPARIQYGQVALTTSTHRKSERGRSPWIGLKVR